MFARLLLRSCSSRCRRHFARSAHNEGRASAISSAGRQVARVSASRAGDRAHQPPCLAQRRSRRTEPGSFDGGVPRRVHRRRTVAVVGMVAGVLVSDKEAAVSMRQGAARPQQRRNGTAEAAGQVPVSASALSGRRRCLFACEKKPITAPAARHKRSAEQENRDGHIVPSGRPPAHPGAALPPDATSRTARSPAPRRSNEHCEAPITGHPMALSRSEERAAHTGRRRPCDQRRAMLRMQLSTAGLPPMHGDRRPRDDPSVILRHPKWTPCPLRRR